MFKGIQILLIGGMMLVIFHSRTFAEFSYYCEVTALNLNIRGCADVSCEIISTVPKGAQFYVVQQIGDWYKIQDSEGNEGFVHENYVRLYKLNTSTSKKENIHESKSRKPDSLERFMNIYWACRGNYSILGWTILRDGECFYGFSFKGKETVYTSKKGTYEYTNDIIYETYPNEGSISWRIEAIDDNNFYLFPLNTHGDVLFPFSILGDERYLCKNLSLPIEQISVYRTIDRKTGEKNGYIAIYEGKLYLWEYFCNECWVQPLLTLQDVKENHQIEFMGYIPCLKCEDRFPENAKK